MGFSHQEESRNNNKSLIRDSGLDPPILLGDHSSSYLLIWASQLSLLMEFDFNGFSLRRTPVQWSDFSGIICSSISAHRLEWNSNSCYIGFLTSNRKYSRAEREAHFLDKTGAERNSSHDWREKMNTELYYWLCSCIRWNKEPLTNREGSKISRSNFVTAVVQPVILCVFLWLLHFMLFISLNSWKPLYRNDYCMISTGKAELFWDLQLSLKSNKMPLILNLIKQITGFR